MSKTCFLFMRQTGLMGWGGFEARPSEQTQTTD
jgi:hypothetical protein